MQLQRHLTSYFTIVSIIVILINYASFAFADRTELEMIRSAIEAKNGQWQAKETWLTRLPTTERETLSGGLDPTFYYGSAIPVKWTVPTSTRSIQNYFNWANQNGTNWMTDIRYQGSCGSCAAFAALGAFEPIIRLVYNNATMSLDLSEQHLFSCGGGDCVAGWYLNEALDYCRDSGVPDEACLPYTQQDDNCGDTCTDWQSRAWQIDGWHWITTGSEDVAALKNAIAQKPVPCRMVLYDDFYSYGGGVYEYSWGSYRGGHFVVMVGWDDSQNAWICKNSWGSNWGENGYFHIKRGQVNIGTWGAFIDFSVPGTATATPTGAWSQTPTPFATPSATSTSPSSPTSTPPYPSLTPTSTPTSTPNRPPNDTCPGQTISIPAVVSGATNLAQNNYQGICGNSNSPDVVYNLTTTTVKNLSLRLTGDFDTVLYVQSRCGAPLYTIYCNDNGTGGIGTSDIDLPNLNPGAYYIIIDGRGYYSYGLYQLSVQEYTPSPTVTATMLPSMTPTQMPSYSATPTATVTPYHSPSPTSTYQRTSTPTPSRTPMPSPTPAQTATPVTSVWSMPLSQGWNSWAYPGLPTQNMTTQVLAGELNDLNIPCTHIGQWTGGGWSIYQHGLPFNNFTLELGKGYFIRSEAYGVWLFEGLELNTSQQLTFSSGWNFVSLPYSDVDYTASTLAAAIIAGGGQIQNVARWSGSSWQIYQVGLPFNNFGIEKAQGYFIRAESYFAWAP